MFLDAKPAVRGSCPVDKCISNSLLEVTLTSSGSIAKPVVMWQIPSVAVHPVHAVTADPNSDSNAGVTGSVDVSRQFLQHIRDGNVHSSYFADERSTSEHTFVGGHWSKGDLITVPDVHDLGSSVSLHQMGFYAGHLGRDMTAHLVQQTCRWPGHESDER